MLTATHYTCRHCPTDLPAALGYLDGQAIFRPDGRRTNVEWLRILQRIDREPPLCQEPQLGVDNYATHRHSPVRE